MRSAIREEWGKIHETNFTRDSTFFAYHRVNWRPSPGVQLQQATIRCSRSQSSGNTRDKK
jgi:hypothetical protein